VLRSDAINFDLVQLARLSCALLLAQSMVHHQTTQHRHHRMNQHRVAHRARQVIRVRVSDSCVSVTQHTAAGADGVDAMA
jgi:hypothetical protein